MKFLILFKADQEKEVDIPPCKDLPQMGAFIADLTAAGILLSTEGLHPSSKGARVRLSTGNATVTDGPFAETKELVAGVALVKVNSKQEAVDLAQRFLKVAGQGAAEVREVIEN